MMQSAKHSAKQSNKQPNILFIMSDDHAAHAISCYSEGRINSTPHLDRLAARAHVVIKYFVPTRFVRHHARLFYPAPITT